MKLHNETNKPGKLLKPNSYYKCICSDGFFLLINWECLPNVYSFNRNEEDHAFLCPVCLTDLLYCFHQKSLKTSESSAGKSLQRRLYLSQGAENAHKLLNATFENVNAFNKELFLLENAVFWVCLFVFTALSLTSCCFEDSFVR